MRVTSSDHVSVAIHEFGGAGRPLLLSHATGFHGYCYLPIADELSDEFTSFALDYRGHGDTARPDDWQVDWTRYGDDALAAARAIAPDGGLVGFGHSMGGAGLLMAAHRDPGLFDVIVAFEPIVFPPREIDPHDGTENNGTVLSRGARKRRASFESFDEAIANYSSKPPMMAFDPDVLRLYVAHGFRPSPEGVRLKCDPEHEARHVRHRWITHDVGRPARDRDAGRRRRRQGRRVRPRRHRPRDRRGAAERQLRRARRVEPLRPVHRPGGDGSDSSGRPSTL